MSTQIAIRLPDSLVDDVDELVRSGRARSRASLIESALRRELRLLRFQEEVELLSEVGADDDLADLVSQSSRTALDIE